MENAGPRAAPIRRCLSPTTSVVRTMVATGRGEAQSPSTTNCAAPEKTSALIRAPSQAPKPACPASVPKTSPMAKPLIPMGTHRFAPSSAPRRVKLTAVLSISPVSPTVSSHAPSGGFTTTS